MRHAASLLLVAGCGGPNYTPTELPWSVHAMTASADHTLVLTEVGLHLDAGTVETDGPPIALPVDPSTSTPIMLALPTATAIAVGARHACIVSAAQVTCWGDNERGALGAHRTCTAGACVLAPGVMPTLPPIRALAAGVDVTCATASDGQVLCWGEHAHGELGGSIVSALDPPMPVRLADGKPLYADRVAIVDSTACAIDRFGAAWCWGDGYGAAPQRLAFTAVVDVAIGHDHGCAIAGDGLTCWGDNRNGQIDAPSARQCTDACTLPPTHLAVDARRVVVGARHTCALGATGDVTCWGSNEHGQLAHADAFLVGDPTVAFTGAVELVAGATRTCALTADHQAWCWGDS